MKRILCLLLLAALYAVPAYCEGMPPATVVVEEVKKETVSMTSGFVGKVEFERVSSVVAEVPGKVSDVKVSEGGYVASGDVLATVDTVLLESDIAVLESELAEVSAKLENSEKRTARAKELFEKGVISRQDYDDQYYTDKTLAMEKQTTENKLAKKKIELSKSTVRAPFNGIVLERLKDPGEWIKPEDPVCTVASTDDVYVSVAVPEDIVRYVSVGDRLSLRIDAIGKELEGKVSGVVPVADQISRNYTIKVKVPYFKKMLRNMSALVHVPVSPKRELGILKRAAIISNQGKNFVYTVKDGKAAILPVNIVAYLGDSVGVDDPYIVAGMPVVVAGNERLMPDQPVSVAEGR